MLSTAMTEHTDERDVLPRLWYRAATTSHLEDKKLFLEAANLIMQLRNLYGFAQGVDEKVAFQLGIRPKLRDS